MCQCLLVLAAECGGVRSGAPPVDDVGSRENMDSNATIEDEMGAPVVVVVAFAPSWCAENERCEAASLDRSAWFDCRCQSWPVPTLMPNGMGPCPGLNAPPPTLEPPSDPGDPASGSACMRE